MEEDIDLRKLDDTNLIVSLKECAADERRCLVKMLRRLAEVERRELYAKWGHSSLFMFCVRECCWSEDVACMRIATARAATSFPILYRRLAKGSISLTAAAKLAKHLTEENHKVVLDRCAGLSLRETDRIVADLAPQSEPRDQVRHLGPGKKADVEQNSGGSVDLPLGAGAPADRGADSGANGPGNPDSPAQKKADSEEGKRIEIRFPADEVLSYRLARPPPTACGGGISSG